MKGSKKFMNLLASATCVEIQQEIYWLQKRTVETFFEINLFDDRLTVKDQMFPLTSIHDISYRKKPDTHSIGFLYLHTSYGLKAFYIKEEPVSFVQAYRELRTKRPDLC